MVLYNLQTYTFYRRYHHQHHFIWNPSSVIKNRTQQWHRRLYYKHSAEHASPAKMFISFWCPTAYWWYWYLLSNPAG